VHTGIEGQDGRKQRDLTLRFVAEAHAALPRSLLSTGKTEAMGNSKLKALNQEAIGDRASRPRRLRQ
jgi:hypothetical protein